MQYEPADLSEDSLAFLAARTATISGKAAHSEKVETARKYFKSKANIAFRDVLKKLNAIAPGRNSDRGVCYYCEHDRQSAIEHIYPLSHYPELSHAYDNLILACTVCNSFMKNDRFAVFQGGVMFEFDSEVLAGAAAPSGDAVLLNPRSDSPTDFLQIDLETGIIQPIRGLGQRDQLRAEYTIRLLGLNKDALPDRRREYFDMYCGRLAKLLQAIEVGDAVAVERMVSAIERAIHPSVLFEMKRQRLILGGLALVFDSMPESFAGNKSSFI